MLGGIRLLTVEREGVRTIRGRDRLQQATDYSTLGFRCIHDFAAEGEGQPGLNND
jgi:hypothetical protein